MDPLGETREERRLDLIRIQSSETWGLGFSVCGLGFRVYGVGCKSHGCMAQSLGMRVHISGLRFEDVGCGVYGSVREV